MTPDIPLSPQQRRQRRNNILFFCSCAGATIAIVTYLFLPRNSEEEPAANHTPPMARPAQSDAPESPESQNALLAEEALSPTAGISSAQDDAVAGKNARLSEEELAKLPPWQAAIARLDTREQQAFAQAFISAKAAYSAEQWASCLAHLNACDLIYNGSPNVWNLRACALIESNELDEAEACIKRSLSLNPQDSVALMCQSELHMLRRDFRACLPILQQLRQSHEGEKSRGLHDTFTFHLLLCHLMLRQEMEARALVADCTPLTDSPLYYFSQAAFSVYKGNSNGALEPLRSATTIYGNGSTASYRKWMNKCGLADKYVRNKRP